jgi:hypothetical protein
MTVAELIKELEKYPQDLRVVYPLYSEQCLMEPKDIAVGELCLPRPDGWVANNRPDKPTEKYLVLPG